MKEKSSLGPSAAGARVWGPYNFVTPSFRGTVKFLRYSADKGIAWLRVEGTGVDEILEVEFRGDEFSFIRTLDCRFGKERPIFQKFNGFFMGDSYVQGGFSGSDQPAVIVPWQGQKK